MRPHPECNRSLHPGLTLIEIVVAMAIMALVMAAVLPQFRNIENSWASKQGRSDAMQNARIIIDHINRNLCRAQSITAVSAPDAVNGFIEYKDSEGLTYRYHIGGDKNVHFGPVGSLAELGGPVAKLQFVCYGLRDLDTPTTDVTQIRLIKAVMIVVNAAANGLDQQVTTCVHLRLAGDAGGIKSIQPLPFSNFTGQESALAQIDARHFLCAYSDSIRGWAVVLAVDDRNWTISKGDNYRFESDLLLTPSLAKIDDDHYLCAYTGPGFKGWAIVLTLNRANWTVGKAAPFTFDSNTVLTPKLSQIDDTRYLCAYTGKDLDGYALVLTVDQSDWSISAGPSLEFDTSRALTPALSRIDDTHHLCAYTGPSSDGWAVVLTVNTADYSLSRQIPMKFDAQRGVTPSLARINDTRHLCVYQGTDKKGWATVLSVDTMTWRITQGTPLRFDSSDSIWPAVCLLRDTDFLCVYARPGLLVQKGMATLLTVNGSAVSSSMDIYEYSSDGNVPATIRIDDTHGLCAYDGRWLRGTATVLEVGQGIGP